MQDSTFDLDSGRRLVKIARRAIEQVAEHKRKDLKIEGTENKKLNEKHGVFVTIKKFKDNSLRGCIGFISPSPLWEAVQRAAVMAAFCDPRFAPIVKDELNELLIEVSIMSEPSLVVAKNKGAYKNKINIGRDGLIIFNKERSGLLLPQVPIEQEWDCEDFLENLCYKAGMLPDMLDDENTKIMRFQCQIFAEKEPDGEIVEIQLK